jgi:hypothetical protein
MICMAKRKKQSGEHSTPRKPVQIPANWLKVAKTLAATRPAPVVWYLIELVKRDAEAAGIKDLPPVPWAVNGK